MKIEYFEDPVPHFIIDDIFPNQANRKIFDEIVSLEKDFVKGGVNYDVKPSKKSNEIHDLILRNNKICVLRGEKYQKYFINTATQFYFNSLVFGELLSSKPKSIFPIVSHCNSLELLVGSYGMCDYIGW